MCGEPNAPDAVHNGFLHAFRRRSTFRGEASLETWLWRTVINAAHDLRARDRDVPVAEPEALAIAIAHPHRDSEEALQAAILALPSQQKLTLFLRYYADLDYRAIAEVLEVSPGTVGAALHKAHTAVREQLKEAV